jgi:DNA-binding ferritin-like protein
MNDIYLEAFELLNSLYGSFRLAHWNVVGKDFYSLHLLFQRIYTTLGAQIDGFAEQIRGAGLEIPASTLNSTPEIDWETCQELVMLLNMRVSELRIALSAARSQAESEEDIGFLALLEGLLTEVNTIKYLLSSSLIS